VTGYDYYKVAQFADELEVAIQNNNGKLDEYGDHSPNYDPDVIDYLEAQYPNA
jgi:hypothetical protein